LKPLEIKGWVNGNLYLPTSERLGILPIPVDVRVNSGIAEFTVGVNTKKVAHTYLAQMQGTRKAVLPVHTAEEGDLFTDLMATEPTFNSRVKGPTFKLAVKVWNERAENSDNVFYKVRWVLSQISSFY
jgi:hypothetical protein